MCGIVGITSKKPFSVKDDLIFALKKLEYRGYDSSGIATTEGIVQKEIGGISNLIKKLPDSLKSVTGIGHTRWATHGGITKANSHPHQSNNIFLAHNGIIENFEELKENLEKKGYKFYSETDSEVIVNYLEEELKKKTPQEAIRTFMREAKGTYGVLFFLKGEDTLWAFKKDSPLCLGVHDGVTLVGSDIYAFSHVTNKVVFLEDYEFAKITPGSYTLYNLEGDLKKDTITIEWEREPVFKKHFDHYMLKEIYEQPEAVNRLLKSLRTTQKTQVKEIGEMIKGASRVLFLACGTSYHASLIGSYLLTRRGYEAHAVIASEFEAFSLIDEKTVIIVVSQSGETMDIISVLKDVAKFNPKLVAIVNYPYSTIHRMADNYLEMMAGQEICVAATKTFTNSLIALYEIAKVLDNHITLDKIPEKIEYVLKNNEKKIQKLAKKLKNCKDIFVLGHQISYPVSREIALKLKEISYVHAEGMMAGELKHGTIALIEKGVPVIGLSYDTVATRMKSALREVEAHGADVYNIGNGDSDFDLPETNEEEFSILSTIIGHLLSYYIAVERGLPIDKPRNLAKSVTVK